MKTDAFTERTYTDGVVEVMVHHRTKDDKAIAVYTYAKDASEFDGLEDGETGKQLAAFRWLPGRNPLFVHLSKRQIAHFVGRFCDSGDLVCSDID